ncbi:MAG: N-acetyltransferase [Candidatus Obscuribacter sp.]|nr:N-acetyltransferase [Candidatus Obscuribacter sp.]
MENADKQEEDQQQQRQQLQQEVKLRQVDWDRDFPQLLAIERQSFRSPWDSRKFAVYSSLPKNRALVAELTGQEGIVGYMLYELQATSSNYLGSSTHIAHIAVDPRHRRLGIGRLMIGAVTRSDAVTLYARLSNTDAQRLYVSLGFYIHNIVAAHYSDGEDAVLMRWGQELPYAMQ